MDRFERLRTSLRVIVLVCREMSIAHVPCNTDVFRPLFEVTRDPRSHPELHIFLQRVIGFDTVDDESKIERRIHKKFPYPRLWDFQQSPPYSYWYVSVKFHDVACWDCESGSTTCSQIWRAWIIGGGCVASVSPQPLEILYCHLTGHWRYIRVPPSLWRSWRYWPPDIGFPHIAFHISWNLAAQGSCPSIFVLPQANRNSDEPLEQQRIVFDIRTKPAPRFLQDWVECQFKHRWPTSVPLHQGWVLSNSRSTPANKWKYRNRCWRNTALQLMYVGSCFVWLHLNCYRRYTNYLKAHSGNLLATQWNKVGSKWRLNDTGLERNGTCLARLEMTSIRWFVLMYWGL